MPPDLSNVYGVGKEVKLSIFLLKLKI